LRPGQGRPLAEIKDGLPNTLVVIEVPSDQAVPWMAPVDADEALVLQLGMDAKHQSPHPGGFEAAFSDGHARFLRNELSAEKRRALISIAGGEEFSERD
jgi:hypothetical protein